jgi:hypothetical protein
MILQDVRSRMRTEQKDWHVRTNKWVLGEQ